MSTIDLLQHLNHIKSRRKIPMYMQVNFRQIVTTFLVIILPIKLRIYQSHNSHFELPLLGHKKSHSVEQDIVCKIYYKVW